jgi:sterol desaturase/sphingolipid hydroxylase (fatty acid hydroxylase superfamily)
MTNLSNLERFFEQLKYWLPVFFISLIILETIILLVRFRKFHFKETRVNVITGLVAILAQSIVKVYFLTNLYPSVYEHRIWDIGLTPAAWVLGFFLYTFLQFATHYFYHKVRLFWCLHEVHHSAIHMNTTTGLRNSIFDIVSLDIFFLLIPLIGINPLVYFILYTLNKFWGSLIHINENIISRIPLLEYILVTPSIHHIHHARNIPYLDKNYGEIIPWYDKLFGTYAPTTEKPVYGTLHVQYELGFWETQVHEFKKMVKDMRGTKKWRHKFGYLFMPPGWQPGDASQTAHALQKEYATGKKNKPVSNS